MHFNVTRHPTARWTAQQIVEACPWDTLPKYLLRDRDGIYGEYFQSRIQNMGINEVKTAPRSPWHNPYVERLIGSIRRDCLNNMIVLNEDHLKRILKGYFDYYHRTEPILALAKKRQQADQCWKSLTTPKCLLSHDWVVFTIGMNGRMQHKGKMGAGL